MYPKSPLCVNLSLRWTCVFQVELCSKSISFDLNASGKIYHGSWDSRFEVTATPVSTVELSVCPKSTCCRVRRPCLLSRMSTWHCLTCVSYLSLPGVPTLRKPLRPLSQQPLSKLHQLHPRHPLKSPQSLRSALQQPQKNQVTK